MYGLQQTIHRAKKKTCWQDFIASCAEYSIFLNRPHITQQFSVTAPNKFWRDFTAHNQLHAKLVDSGVEARL